MTSQLNKYISILTQRGFKKYASINLMRKTVLFFDPDKYITVSAIDVGEYALLKASKAYYMTAVGEDGETYARDFDGLHDWFYGAFSETHINIYTARDISRPLAFKTMKNKGWNGNPNIMSDAIRIEKMKQQHAAYIQELKETDETGRLLGDKQDKFLKSFLTRRKQELKQTALDLKNEIDALGNESSYTKTIINEYLRKGRVVYYIFAICSDAQIVIDETQFLDVLDAVVKEIMDYDRYQIRQKMNHGKFRINIEEVDVPEFALYTLLSGGPLNPRQLEKIVKEHP